LILTNGRLTGLSIVLTIGFSTTGVALLLELENQSTAHKGYACKFEFGGGMVSAYLQKKIY
jgi:hypothetical protein